MEYGIQEKEKTQAQKFIIGKERVLYFSQPKPRRVLRNMGHHSCIIDLCRACLCAACNACRDMAYLQYIYSENTLRSDYSAADVKRRAFY